MKKINLILLFTLLTASVFIACKTEEPNKGNDFIPVSRIVLNVNTLTLYENEEYTLLLTIYPEIASDKTVTWTSTNVNVASVENGKITALSVGETTIEAKVGEQTAICNIVVKSIPENGILINRVVWAKTNVGLTTGTFVSKPEDYGGYYQWNRKDATVFFSPNDYSIIETYSWLPENDPSPEGWRVPKLSEITTLMDTQKVISMWTKVNGVYGLLYIDKATNNSIFMPAAGFRDFFDGLYYNKGQYCCYWSGTAADYYYAYFCLFNTSFTYPDIYSCAMGYGQSIRPVAK